MIPDYEIVAIEYEGIAPTYDNDDAVVALATKLKEAFEESFVLKVGEHLCIYVCADGIESLKSFLLKEPIHLPLQQFCTTREAATHLFDITSGIKSNLLGETDILHTISHYKALAENAGTLGRYLLLLLEDSVSCGKTVRAHTHFADMKRAWLVAGMDLIKDHFLSLNLRYLILGTGALAEGILEFLQDEGVERVYIASQEHSAAEKLAKDYLAFPLMIENIGVIFPEVDVVICCGSKAELFNALFENQEDSSKDITEQTPPLVVDYDTSSNFPHAKTSIPHYYFNKYAVGKDGKLKNSDLLIAQRLIDSCFQQFLKKFQHQKAKKLLTDYRVKLKTVEEQELQHLFSRLEGTSEEEKAQIRAFSSSLLAKIADDMIQYLGVLVEKPLEEAEHLKIINKIIANYANAK